MLFILGDISNLLLSLNARIKKKMAYDLGATGATEEITLFYPRMMFRTHSRPYYVKSITKTIYTWLKKRCRLKSINHERWELMDLWVELY